MLKIIGIVAALVVAAVLGIAATRPDTFRVERSASISAPPDKIYPLINDFHAWQAWSPWEKMDPAMKRTFGDNTVGKGATYTWEGNSKVGQGSMQITESAAPSKVTIDLHFIKPMEGRDVAEFTLTPNGNATTVSWAMHGPNPFIAKVIGLFCNMDRMIGKDFETGLGNLKALAEK